jgi:RNA polymerase sigma-70 factor (ECF subfamily)
VVTELSDEHLIELALQGSQDCFAQIVLRYSGNLLRFVAAGVASMQDAEDIVQETFLNVYKNMHQFDLRCSFKSWLFAIANNCKISHLRKQRPRAHATDFIVETVAAPDDIVAQRQEADSIWDHAARLSESQYTALWLRYKEQMDVNQIARIMQKSHVHVRVLLHRARTRLADDLVNRTAPGHTGVSTPLQGR